MPTMRPVKNMAVPTTRTRGQAPETYNQSRYEEELDIPFPNTAPHKEVGLPTLVLGEEVRWRAQGACVGSGVDFLPDILNEKAIAACKAVCANCPVINECRDFAIDNDIDFYVYGGMTPKERKSHALHS